MGLDVALRDECYEVTSSGLSGMKAPIDTLDAGNSGTTIRLLAGLVAGFPFKTVFDGDSSLRKRPMARVLKPLSEMGTTIGYDEKENYPPFHIKGGELKGREFSLAIASAQVQTALLLAGLQAEGETSVTLPAAARDHTERMFSYIGVTHQSSALKTSVKRLEKAVSPFKITVPGDISSAAFFMVAAACAPGSHVVLTDVGLNPGRTLILDVLKEMGADIEITNRREEGCEPIGTIIVRGNSRLQGTAIHGDRIAAGIDEIPILALAGAFCEGQLTIRDAHELRVKESDRLAAIAANLRRAGADVTEHEDGLDIKGQRQLEGGSEWQTFGDHRLAMAGLVARLLCRRPVKVDDIGCVAVSYPHFQQDLDKLTKGA